jgi:hypothetical protein
VCRATLFGEQKYGAAQQGDEADER